MVWKTWTNIFLDFNFEVVPSSELLLKIDNKLYFQDYELSIPQRSEWWKTTQEWAWVYMVHHGEICVDIWMIEFASEIRLAIHTFFRDAKLWDNDQLRLIDGGHSLII